MSFLFGAGRDVRDPELAAATRRRQLAMARDLGDERTQANIDEPPRYRRPGRWLVVFVLVVVVLGGLNALRGHGGAVAITRSCSTPALAVRTAHPGAGDDLDWSATGPSNRRYVVVSDGTPTGVDDRGRVTVDAGSALTPLFPMDGCVVHSTLSAPKRTGPHTLRMFERTGSGYRVVASRAVTVR